MCHEVLSDSRLWPFLFEIDRDLATKTHEGGCLFCGAPLHRANYPRKPRGADDLLQGYGLRFSFCCSADTCRRRATPPSVRFLGPKVYLKVLVIIVSAMRQGPTPHGIGELHRLFGITRRTIARWQKWWREIFPRTLFWKEARARFMPPLPEGRLLLELARAFDIARSIEKFLSLLRFLAPISIRKGLALHPS